MSAQFIQPEGMPKPPTYTPVARNGNTAYIAGQTAQNEKGEGVGKGDPTAQAEQIFDNLRKCLASVGASFQHLVNITVFLTDARFREPVAAVRAKYLEE